MPINRTVPYHRARRRNGSGLGVTLLFVVLLGVALGVALWAVGAYVARLAPLP